MNSARKPSKTETTGAGSHVETVTVGQLQTDFKAVEAKLARGMRVHVTRRGAVVAEMVAPTAYSANESQPSDLVTEFARERQASRLEIWAGQPSGLDITNWLLESRNRDDVL